MKLHFEFVFGEKCLSNTLYRRFFDCHGAVTPFLREGNERGRRLFGACGPLTYTKCLHLELLISNADIFSGAFSPHP